MKFFRKIQKFGIPAGSHKGAAYTRIPSTANFQSWLDVESRKRFHRRHEQSEAGPRGSSPALFEVLETYCHRNRAEEGNYFKKMTERLFHLSLNKRSVDQMIAATLNQSEPVADAHYWRRLSSASGSRF